MRTFFHPSDFDRNRQECNSHAKYDTRDGGKEEAEEVEGRGERAIGVSE